MTAGLVALVAVALAALAALGAALWAVRSVLPRRLERAHARQFPVGPDGVILGAEAVDLRLDGSGAGVLLLHGLGDSPQAMRALAAHLHAHRFAVRGPLLAGHGRDLAAFRSFAADAWREQVRREFATLRAQHAWVGIVGLSVGGALALDLAAERADVGALVLLAPYVAMPPWIRALARTSGWWGPFFPYLPSLGSRSIHDPDAQARGLGPGITTPAALRALRTVVGHAAVALPRVSAPTLTIQSRLDNRISAADAQRAFARLGCADREFVWVEGAGHVITVDHGKERVFQLTADWLVRHRRQ